MSDAQVRKLIVQESIAKYPGRWADKAIDQGDPAGERVWVRITRAVAELLRQKPSGGEALN